MTDIDWTETQCLRLRELDAAKDILERRFDTLDQREQTFHRNVKALTRKNRAVLQEIRQTVRRTDLCVLEERLATELRGRGFVQVTTPILMSGEHLARMGIDADHPLHRQVYWVEKGKCLRPMLAPHLYYISRDFLRLWEHPVGLFEIGPCFRRESQGNDHSSEFTMLNMVEYGMPEDERTDRLNLWSAAVMATVGVDEYRIVTETSEVYGETWDVVVGPDDLEVGSAAMGPHPLDRAWRITTTWVGIGFGLERLLMACQDGVSLARFGRSLTYYNGIRLNI